jgi:DNA-binding NarL/FixJ family response regulator
MRKLPAQIQIPSDRPKEPAPGVYLTPREEEVLRLLMLGKSNKEIAAAFHITERTVKFHVKNLMSKSGVATRTALMALRRKT